MLEKKKVKFIGTHLVLFSLKAITVLLSSTMVTRNIINMHMFTENVLPLGHIYSMSAKPPGCPSMFSLVETVCVDIQSFKHTMMIFLSLLSLSRICRLCCTKIITLQSHVFTHEFKKRHFNLLHTRTKSKVLYCPLLHSEIVFFVVYLYKN